MKTTLNTKKLLSTIMLFSIFSILTVQASSLHQDIGEDIQDLKELTSHKTTSFALRVVNWEGIIQCSNESHSKTGMCDLEFIRTSDSKVFKISKNEKLVKAHCSKHKDLKAEINANVTPSFLVWGGKLVINDYEVLSRLQNRKSKIQVVRANNFLKFERSINKDL